MKKLFLTFCAVIVLLALYVPIAGEAQASSPLADRTWVRLGGPPGGIGYDIKVNPQNTDIWYVTDTFSGIHKSADGGYTWVNSNSGIDVRGGPSGDAVPVFCVTIDPNDPTIIWIGMQNEMGIFRSMDGGNTWERRTNGIQEVEGLTIRGISVEWGNSNTLYAAGEISSWAWAGENRTGRQFDLVKGVIYKSTDGGLNWRAVWRGNNLARYVLVDPTAVNILYASTGIFDREAANSNNQEGNPGGEGILKSMDGGETWEPVNNGLQNMYIGSLSMDPSNPQTLLAGAGNQVYSAGSGIYLSKDGGATWSLMKEEGNVISAVDFSPSNPKILYAAGEVAFLRSEDGGKSWQRTNDPTLGYGWGAKGIHVGIPIDIQVDPNDPMRIFVNNYAGGNMLSEDGGDNWVNASDGYTGEQVNSLVSDPENPAIIYTNGKGGIYQSEDGGMHWKGILPAELRGAAAQGEVAVNPIRPNMVIVSNVEGNLFLSEDRGHSWSQKLGYSNEMWNQYKDTPRLAFQGITNIVYAPSDPQVAYGGFGYGMYCKITLQMNDCSMPTYKNISLFVSKDGGYTWSVIETDGIDGFTIAQVVVHPVDPEFLWIASPQQGVYRSTDGGLTWEEASSGLSKNVISLTLDLQNPDILYAGTIDDGLYISKDGGSSWSKSSSGMDPNETIASIVADPSRPGVLYAGGRRGGVYMSEDQGIMWRSINQGLSTRSVNSLEITADGDTLYAGTYGEGVFRLSVHDQKYFDALAPTPAPTATMPPSTNTPPPGPASAAPPPPSSIPCGSALIAPLVIGLMFLFRRQS